MIAVNRGTCFRSKANPMKSKRSIRAHFVYSRVSLEIHRVNPIRPRLICSLKFKVQQEFSNKVRSQSFG